MRPRFLPALLAVLLGSGGHIPTYAQAGDPEMEKGIRQAQEGEFEQAIATLQGVLPRLHERKAPPHDIARAHVYLGVAHLGLNDPATARTSFLEAIRIDPTLKLSSEEYPPRIVRAFEEARRSAPPAPATAAPPATGVPPRPRRPRRRQRRQVHVLCRRSRRRSRREDPSCPWCCSVSAPSEAALPWLPVEGVADRAHPLRKAPRP